MNYLVIFIMNYLCIYLFWGGWGGEGDKLFTGTGGT
jgi:hypothetical protein